jgi:hypothetical protein
MKQTPLNPARWGTSSSNSKPFERNHDWPLWYRGPSSLSHEYFYRHTCYQRSTGLFAVCCQRRWKKWRMLSIVTPSLLLVISRARLKTISGLIWPVMISPDLHFRDILAFMCSNVFNFDYIVVHPPCLMNISTGIHATREVQDYLLSAVNEGEKNVQKLC